MADKMGLVGAACDIAAHCWAMSARDTTIILAHGDDCWADIFARSNSRVVLVGAKHIEKMQMFEIRDPSHHRHNAVPVLSLGKVLSDAHGPSDL